MYIKLLLTLIFAQQAFSNQLIKNGELAQGDSFGNVVALVGDKNEVFCTGSLISPTIVLTAAHCLLIDRPDKISIYFGNGKLEDAFLPEETELIETLFSQTYADTHKKDTGVDIGFVKLATEIHNIKPAKLITTKKMEKVAVRKKKSLIVGFGERTSKEDPIGSDLGHKSFATAKIYDHFIYKNTINIGRYISPDFEPSAYFGDSGGPAFIDVKQTIYQLGIVSEGLRDEVYVSYTLPHRFLCWLQKNAQLKINHEFNCFNPLEQMNPSHIGKKFLN